jgi:hypothetical protein
VADVRSWWLPAATNIDAIWRLEATTTTESSNSKLLSRQAESTEPAVSHQPSSAPIGGMKWFASLDAGYFGWQDCVSRRGNANACHLPSASSVAVAKV